MKTLARIIGGLAICIFGLAFLVDLAAKIHVAFHTSVLVSILLVPVAIAIVGLFLYCVGMFIDWCFDN